MANYPIYRLIKGSTLTFTEMDGNLEWLSRTMSASIVTITGSTFVLGNLNVSNGVTGSLFGTSSWAVSSSYSPNIYNINGTLTDNRIATIDDKQLVFRSNASTLQNYTFTLGTPTGMSVSTWPASIIFEGEYLMNTANAEPYNTRVWGRNQSTGLRSFWVNQVFADITGESTGATNIYNQLFATRRGSLTDTSTTATPVMRGVWSEIGHRYITNGTPATIVTTNQEAFYADNINLTGNITNVIGFSARNQAGSGISPFTTNITNYYGFYQLSIVVNSKTTITNHYGLFLDVPIIGSGGIIVNRWGMYAPDLLSNHYFNGNLSLGTNETGSYKLLVLGSTKLSGSVEVTGSIAITQNITASNALLTGTLTVQTIVAQTITASTEWITGSSKFGSLVTDTHQFTGSLLAPSITGSLQGTSSWAVSASWAPSAGGGTTLNGSGYVSMSGTNVAYVSSIPNSSLANNSITIQGASTALGGSVNVINGTGFVKSSGTSITYDNNTYYSASNPNGYTSNTGTVTSITVSAGTGMSGGGTLTGAGGTVTLTNAAPDQTVVLNNGTGISVTGTYPNFTIASTVTSVTPSFIATGSVTASVNVGNTAFNLVSSSNNLVTVLSNGNVGIGTTTPSQSLDVNGRIRVGSNPQTEIYSGANRLVFRGDNIDNVAQMTAYGIFLPIINQTYNLYQAGSTLLGYTDTTASLDIARGASGATVYVRLNSNGDSYLNGGNIGIGTTTPTVRLNVSGSSIFAKTVTLTNPEPILNITGSFNTTGEAIALNIDVFNLNSSTASLLDVKENGYSILKISNTSTVLNSQFEVNNNVFISGIAPYLHLNDTNNTGYFIGATDDMFYISEDVSFGTGLQLDALGNLYISFNITASGDLLSDNSGIRTRALDNGPRWKLGDVYSGTITPDSYIKVEINGNIYSIPALTGTP